MRLRTASQVISFVKKLEGDSATFYELLAAKHTRGKDLFLSFAKDNRRNSTQIERAYYSVITDAIEGGFAFDIETDEYALGMNLEPDAAYAEAVGRAVEIERNILRFYAYAITQSKALMADIPRAFESASRRRKDRESMLDSMLTSSNALQSS